MNRNFLYILIVVLVMTANLSAGSMLEIPDNKFNFGYTAQNSTLVHSFWFHSTGDDTLRINEIKTGCSCALMPLEKEWIAPGDSMNVKVIWKIKRRLGPSGKYPYIYTNAQEDPFRIGLDTRVFNKFDNVSDLYVIKPYKAELAKVANKDIDTVEIEFISKYDFDLQIVLIDSNIDECELHIPEILVANDTVFGKVIIKNEYKDKEFVGSFTVEFSDEKRTRVTIPVRRKIYNLSSGK